MPRTKKPTDTPADLLAPVYHIFRERIFEDEELLRRLVAAPRVAFLSQHDGERPHGCKGDGTPEGNRRAADKYLRICREHREELGVVARGKDRLVPVARWEAFIASRSSTARRVPPFTSDEPPRAA